MSLDNPIIRRRIKTVNSMVKSGYSPSLCRWGYSSQINLERGERMSHKMAACFAGVKMKLEQDVPGIIFNPPEIFPINQRQCVVLITGWKPETILLA